MSSSSYGTTIATGETLSVTSAYSVATNLTFQNEGTASGVIIFSRTAIGAGTTTINGITTPVADFGGGTIANMLPSSYLDFGLPGDEISIQSVDTLFNSLDIANTAAADNADFLNHISFAAQSGNHVFITNGTVEMSASTPFTLDANEKTIVDEIALGLFGTAANHATLDISFSERQNPNSNNQFVDAVVMADTPINPCFTEGTFILTTRGEVPVEKLVPGDRVITFEGEEQEIIWIGKRSVDLCSALRPDVLRPVIFEPNALSEGVLARRLKISPDHALYVDGMLVPAKALINWNSIRQDNNALLVTYYHIELPRHDALFADGTPVESFLDTGHRGVFDNSSEVVISTSDAMQAKGLLINN